MKCRLTATIDKYFSMESGGEEKHDLRLKVWCGEGQAAEFFIGGIPCSPIGLVEKDELEALLALLSNELAKLS